MQILLYTQQMETSSNRTWDWTLAGLFIAIVLTAAVRLVETEWTTNLYFGESMGVIGAFIGLVLGASRIGNRPARWLGLGYTLTIVPWQLLGLSDTHITLGERLAELGLRIRLALETVVQGQSAEDPILFIFFTALTLWLVGLIGGYRLSRRLDGLTAILPSGLIVVIVQIYDSSSPERIWLLALYLFLSLLLLGRIYYLKNSRTWKQERVFQMPEAGRDLSNGLLVTAAVVVVITWALPLSLSSLRSAADFWREFVRPLRPLRENISHALDPLNSPYGGSSGQPDFYSETLPLGRGLPLSDDIVLRIQAPARLVDAPPTFYWRGRIFTTYTGTEWINTNSDLASFDSLPEDVPIPDLAASRVSRFVVTNEVDQSLIYSPGQLVWVNKSGEMLYRPLPNQERDIFSIQASPPLNVRETYQVHAALVNPTVEDLRSAGTNYPYWVKNTYLQLPANFSARIRTLAGQIANGKTTPYDKTAAITEWLRANITYQAITPAPPTNADPLEWMLFDYKHGFCVYYATSEVLMLRSLGVPARMAVGFAEGQLDETTNTYTVKRKDYHAWPEVYFPGIGWVEFEPTASQPDLVRPLKKTVVSAPAAGTSIPSEITPTEAPPTNLPSTPTTPVTPWTIQYRALLIGIISALLLLLLWELNRRIGWVGRIPIYIEARLEHGGNVPPRWLQIWAAWIRLPPIGRAYETINLSLRMLGHPQPFHATPAERSQQLIQVLPAAQARVEELTAQHEHALYAGTASDVAQARQAALMILLTTIWTRLIQLGQSFKKR